MKKISDLSKSFKSEFAVLLLINEAVIKDQNRDNDCKKHR